MVVTWLKEKSVLQQFTEGPQERPAVRIRVGLNVGGFLGLGSPSRPASRWPEGAVPPGPFPQSRRPPVSVRWPFCLAFAGTAALSEGFGVKPPGGVLGVCRTHLPLALCVFSELSTPLLEAGCPGALFREAWGAPGVGFLSRDQQRMAFIQGRTDPIFLTTHPVGPRPPAALSPGAGRRPPLTVRAGGPSRLALGSPLCLVLGEPASQPSVNRSS